MKPDQSEPVADEISHALSIDGIQTSSDASTVHWTIEVSKNDLLSTASSSGNKFIIIIIIIIAVVVVVVVPSLVAPTISESVKKGGKQTHYKMIIVLMYCMYRYF